MAGVYNVECQQEESLTEWKPKRAEERGSSLSMQLSVKQCVHVKKIPRTRERVA